MHPTLQFLLRPAFEIWGGPVTVIELLAVGLSIAMVVGNLRVRVWAWPLAIAASACYALLFAASALYGEAALQLIFIAVSAWGWLKWWRPSEASERGCDVGTLLPAQRARLAGLVLLAWPALGLLLKRATDTDVPFADALPTVASVAGQWLLATKRIENWWVWLGVNVYSVGLFAYKQLWLTALLYAAFALMSWLGLRAWRQRMAAYA